ncbi:9082_t:CDS:2, partial [Gigaspora rosea]
METGEQKLAFKKKANAHGCNNALDNDTGGNRNEDPNQYTRDRGNENRITVVEAESIGPHSAEGESLAVEFDPTVV